MLTCYHHYYYFVFILFHLFYFIYFILLSSFFYQLIVLLVAASFSTARLYQEIKTNKAKGVTTEDYPLSRFFGLGRAVGDNTKQFPGIVHMDKRQCTAMNQMFMDSLFDYLKSNLSVAHVPLRHICRNIGNGACKSFSSCERCQCLI